MNKGKFASLILLGAFSAGVASSSAVSARADENLVSVVEDDKGASSQDDSVTTDFKFSDESVSVSDENNIYLEQQTDEETQDDSTDGSSNERNDAENLDKNIEYETDLPKDSDKENSENGDNLSVNNDKKQNVKKSNGVGIVKGFTVAGVSASAVGGATFGISKLLNLSGDNKKDEPITDPTTDPNPEPDDNPNDTGDDDPGVKNVDGVKDNKAEITEIIFNLGMLLIVWLIFWFIVVIFVLCARNKKDYVDEKMIVNN